MEPELCRACAGLDVGRRVAAQAPAVVAVAEVVGLVERTGDRAARSCHVVSTKLTNLN